MENRRKQKTNYIISVKICMIKMKCKKYQKDSNRNYKLKNALSELKKCRRSINKRFEQVEESDNFNTVYLKLSIQESQKIYIKI